MVDPFAYYSPEANLFPHLAGDFADSGQLDPAAFYLILDWKAPRARTKHLIRLARLAGTFEGATREIADGLHKATNPERLKVLMTKWSFRLPTASAILAVLCPDAFTVCDVRVCRMVNGFDNLCAKSWSAALWEEYERFVEAVRAAAVSEGAPYDASLRDCDRWLWGKDKQNAMNDELNSHAEISPRPES